MKNDKWKMENVLKHQTRNPFTQLLVAHFSFSADETTPAFAQSTNKPPESNTA
jgi:hypothetical protein